jgi:hypothetical protein
MSRPCSRANFSSFSHQPVSLLWQIKKQDQPWDIAMYIKQVLWQKESNPKQKVTFFIGGTVGPDDPQFA